MPEEVLVDTRLRLTRDGAIAGTVTTGDAEPLAFHGWLELMDLLERVRASNAVAGER